MHGPPIIACISSYTQTYIHTQLAKSNYSHIYSSLHLLYSYYCCNLLFSSYISFSKVECEVEFVIGKQKRIIVKMKTPSLLKKILAALSSKTNELRIRIMIFFLLHKNIDKSALTHKLHALVSHHNHHNIPHLKKKKIDEFIEDSEEKIEETQFEDQEEVYNNHEAQQKNPSLLMYYNKVVAEGGGAPMESVPRMEEDEEENLTHVLFKESVVALEEEEEEEEGVEVEEGGGAVEEVVEEAEEDIDQAADMFIKRFKQQIQLQKQYSLERHNQRVLQATV